MKLIILYNNYEGRGSPEPVTDISKDTSLSFILFTKVDSRAKINGREP